MTSMPRSRPKPKPDSAREAARVLRVFDMLVEELARRYAPMPHVIYDAAKATIEHDGTIPALLAIADRIAARTEDPS